MVSGAKFEYFYPSEVGIGVRKFRPASTRALRPGSEILVQNTKFGFGFLVSKVGIFDSNLQGYIQGSWIRTEGAKRARYRFLRI